MIDTMTRPIRLIGGPFDGQIRNVDPDQDDLTTRERMPAPVQVHRNFGLAPASETIKTAHYTRREVSLPAGIITFFAVDKMSDFEALQHVLGP